MFNRPFWEKKIKESWQKAPIVWLSGPRRSGKTTISKMIGKDDGLYINCDLPSSADMLKNPEIFFKDLDKKIVIFDEIHNLKDPSLVLKIGADNFSHIKIIATGSSTLAASHKFRDTLTGRKRDVRLLPVLKAELSDFGGISLQKRIYHGGLPPALLSKEKDNSFYREWSDSFFSRDIQKLFGFKDWSKFNIFLEYLMKESGGIFEISKASSVLGISRITVSSWLRALEITGIVNVLRPFFGGKKGEITKMPKVYGFDTGFVSFFKGWQPLRNTDLGFLWEHIVLDHLLAVNPDKPVRYWRDKSGYEVDFVIPCADGFVDAYECKWSPDEFSPSSLKSFRQIYPKGNNYLITPLEAEYRKDYKGLKVILKTISLK